MPALTADALERVLVDATDREPDSELVDRPDWVQLRTPSSTEARRNAVFRARLSAEEARAVIADVLAEHVDRGARMRWIVGPSSAPATLSDAVATAGLDALGPTLGMARDVPNEDLPLGVPGLTLHAVETPADADAYGEASAVAWQRDADFAREIGAAARQALVRGSSSRSWIARLDGEPVAVTHLRLLPGVGYLQGAAVRPSSRGRGIYRALIHHRLAVLRRAGLSRAVVWADASGSGVVCRKLGFDTVCTADFFESRRPATAPGQAGGP